MNALSPGRQLLFFDSSPGQVRWYGNRVNDVPHVTRDAIASADDKRHPGVHLREMFRPDALEPLGRQSNAPDDG